ncbi:DUF3450 domain-containing protein [uncultured Nevskia sp.]|uniref:DUF3450 domain-containing protein n=1 Tax=uncultured Nevskia sp. TaxID=228950 RepID=UPI0025CFE70F|nr:DUF3450 domain-containing protein [uncultured Nevskia sp.]
MSRLRFAAALLSIISSPISGPVWAQGGSPAVDATVQANQAAKAAQTRIDALDDQTRNMLERYRAAIWQAQQLKVYAEQIEPLLATQEAERAALAAQARDLATNTRDLTPLLLKMIDSLDKFIALDLPFLQAERRDRIASLKQLMTDPAVTQAEKYRRVVEAYRIEGDYGRVFGAERMELSEGSDKKLIDVLRVGRTALYGLTLDDREALHWDPAKKQWVGLPEQHRGEIREALRIARETAAPLVVKLPVPAPRMAAAGAQP